MIQEVSTNSESILPNGKTGFASSENHGKMVPPCFEAKFCALFLSPQKSIKCNSLIIKTALFLPPCVTLVLRIEWVPYAVASRPIEVTQSRTIRAYWWVEM